MLRSIQRACLAMATLLVFAFGQTPAPGAAPPMPASPDRGIGGRTGAEGDRVAVQISILAVPPCIAEKHLKGYTTIHLDKS